MIRGVFEMQEFREKHNRVSTFKLTDTLTRAHAYSARFRYTYVRDLVAYYYVLIDFLHIYVIKQIDLH